jgi:ubiquinone/menaquinone biosynthesis C-methylase UbiE
MSNQQSPRSEHPSTYFVQDRSSQEELNRLHVLDHMTTTGMGGTLPEQSDPSLFQRVLDVGCGTGGWLINVAKAYPTMKLLVGVDVSLKFVEYARAQAEAEQVSNRVEFHVMDALRMLEFPSGFFDLVNHRLGISWIRTWDWPKLLQEYQRVIRSGGVIRITEGECMVVSNSPALTRLFELSLQAFYQARHLFTPTGDGLTNELARLLHQHGMQQVQTQAYSLSYQAGTPEGQYFFENNRLGFRTIVPFLRKWMRVPEDYDALYQQMLDEMRQPDFVATWNLLTAWGTVPRGKRMREDITR